MVVRKFNSQLIVGAFALVMSTGAGCASLRSVSMTPVPAKRGQMIEEEVKDWSFLGINFSNEFVDELRDKLSTKCRGGKVTGLLTKYETYYYVLVVKRQVKATGYCEKSAKI